MNMCVIRYIALATLRQCDRATNTEDFWTDTAVIQEIPATAKTARMCMLFPPSSAAAERTFSILNAMFGDLQNSALGDYQAAAVMARCNALYREA